MLLYDSLLLATCHVVDSGCLQRSFSDWGMVHAGVPQGPVHFGPFVV